MVEVYKISTYQGSVFKTSKPETIALYKHRVSKAINWPMRITRVHKKRYK